MAKPLGIALVGCGTVGGGVVELLSRHAERLRQATGGIGFALKHVVVKDLKKTRPGFPAGILHTDWKAAVSDPATDVVLELIGGTGTARELVLAALAAGKPVITANKALLAAHGRELFDAARAANTSIGFEAAVAGGIPIIKTLAESLAANQITAIQGILNGTSNFILTRMAEAGASYDAALREAQARGYAEADLTLDVNGTDAAHKLAVLAQIAFGVTPDLKMLEIRGIAGLDAMDIRFAAELGYTVKLLAEAWLLRGAEVSLHVCPVLLRDSDLLARVRGAFNAVRVQGDAVGEVVLQGPGAGQLPTASSVLADLVDLAVGRAPRTFAATALWSDRTRGYRVVPAEKVTTRFYLRVLARDKPGVLAEVCRHLAEQEISIASVVQHEAVDGHPEQTVPLVIMTHAAVAGRFRSAVAALDSMSTLSGKAVFFPVSD